MLANDGLVLRQVDAECLVGGDETFNPLDIGAELGEDFVGFRGGPAELLAFQRTDGGDVPFDDVFA